eukprot:TRINITY_DN32601_c0_g1_i1.p1 TRINITY_DN32601_c0_g1~~TRINITY_DN32601_c0_g1_i1.p1  ORF type:complete len:924 (+),score=218.64 TRINITY_DN32601_c0_g1_i1:107-2878(+)
MRPHAPCVEVSVRLRAAHRRDTANSIFGVNEEDPTGDVGYGVVACRAFTSEHQPKYPFDFDRVFFPASPVLGVFTYSVRHITHEVISGGNGAVFCAGHPCGQPYSALLGSLASPLSGLFPLVAAEFLRHGATGGYDVFLSCFSLHAEVLTDLLAAFETGGRAARAASTPRAPSCTRQLARTELASMDDVMHVVTRLKDPKFAKANHIGITFHLEKSAARRRAAGAARSGAGVSPQFHLVALSPLEGGKQGQAYLALQNVLAGLAQGAPCVPYRESRVTYLLRRSLTPSSPVLFLLHAASTPDDYYATLSMLKYAARLRATAYPLTSGSLQSALTGPRTPRRVPATFAGGALAPRHQDEGFYADLEHDHRERWVQQVAEADQADKKDSPEADPPARSPQRPQEPALPDDAPAPQDHSLHMSEASGASHRPPRGGYTAAPQDASDVLSQRPNDGLAVPAEPLRPGAGTTPHTRSPPRVRDAEHTGSTPVATCVLPPEGARSQRGGSARPCEERQAFLADTPALRSGSQGTWSQSIDRCALGRHHLSLSHASSLPAGRAEGTDGGRGGDAGWDTLYESMQEVRQSLACLTGGVGLGPNIKPYRDASKGVGVGVEAPAEKAPAAKPDVAPPPSSGRPPRAMPDGGAAAVPVPVPAAEGGLVRLGNALSHLTTELLSTFPGPGAEGDRSSASDAGQNAQGFVASVDSELDRRLRAQQYETAELLGAPSRDHSLLTCEGSMLRERRERDVVRALPFEDAPVKDRSRPRDEEANPFHDMLARCKADEAAFLRRELARVQGLLDQQQVAVEPPRAQSASGSPMEQVLTEYKGRPFLPSHQAPPSQPSHGGTPQESQLREAATDVARAASSRAPSSYPSCDVSPRSELAVIEHAAARAAALEKADETAQHIAALTSAHEATTRRIASLEVGR